MYFIKNSEIILMADKEFLDMFEYEFFQDLIDESILNKITFNNGIAHLIIKDKLLTAKYDKVNLITNSQNVLHLVRFKDIKFSNKDSDKLDLIYIDLKKISSEIGLSSYDYKIYLNNFIDQAISNEKDILELNIGIINNLLNLSSTLKIPIIDTILHDIKKCKDETKRKKIIDFFYQNLNLLSFTPKKKYNFDWNKKINMNISFDRSQSINVNMLGKILPSNNLDEDNEINLNNIKLLDIDYDPLIAAGCLNLPISLIKEFVIDLIEENRLDIIKLLAFYNKKDVKSINMIAHKLKGATSNLRIEKLTKILTKMQYSINFNDLKIYFYEYAGLFKGLEKSFIKK